MIGSSAWLEGFEIYGSLESVTWVCRALCDKLLCAIRNRCFADCIQRINARILEKGTEDMGRKGMG